MGIKWILRQFLDFFAKHPLRFAFKNPTSGTVNNTYELDWKPGAVTSYGTPTHRGYFQPIEDFLARYETDILHSELNTVDEVWRYNYTATQNDIAAINRRIDDFNTTLNSYAPKANPNFTNPVANSPEVSDNSNKLHPTGWIKEFVSQHSFPPKNIPNFFIMPGVLKVYISVQDPNDFIFDGMTLSVWEGTKVVYRTDRFPNNENDGTVVFNNTLRNFYRDYEFELGGLDSRLTYYFGIFPYTVDGVYNRYNPQNGKSVKPEHDIEIQTLTSLSTARYSYAAATDGAGNVLIGGGWGDRYSNGLGYWLDSVERYDTNGNRTTLASLSYETQDNAAATDGNGAVLFCGGDGGAAVDRYAAGSYTKTRLANLSINASSGWRQGLASATDGNGNVIIAGGVGDGYVYITDRYAPSGVKSTLTSLTYGRQSSPATTDGNGNVWFIAGATGEGTRTIERYSPSGVKTIMPPMLESISASNSAAATDGNGNVIIVGNRGAFERHALDGTRTLASGLPDGGVKAATDRFGNVIVVTFGTSGGNDPTNVFILKPNEFGRIYKAPSAFPQGSTGNVTADGSGNVIIAGGSLNGRLLDTVERYTIIEY